MVGSEGLLGVVTEVTVRILPKPPGARALLIGFPSIEGAGHCVAAIIGAGIIPGGMEMMDRLAVEAAEAFVHAGYPLEAEALLIVELDGCEAEINHLVAVVEGIAARHGATTCRISRSSCSPGPGARLPARPSGGLLDRDHEVLIWRSRPHYVRLGRVSVGGSWIPLHRFGRRSDDHDV